MYSLDTLIIECKRESPEAQKELYARYKDVLYAICVRYVKQAADADDVFIEGFYKIFNHIHQYNDQGSFEGWMKRIIVNESLQFLRRKSKLHIPVELTDQTIAYADTDEEWHNPYQIEEIMAAVQELPDGYRTIFNMYVFEEYKHREIADILGISINTSKSQYLQAKKKVLDILSKSYTSHQLNHGQRK
jgi:RNA polymerase sigma factor (sigma-70 family)